MQQHICSFYLQPTLNVIMLSTVCLVHPHSVGSVFSEAHRLSVLVSDSGHLGGFGGKMWCELWDFSMDRMLHKLIRWKCFCFHYELQVSCCEIRETLVFYYHQLYLHCNIMKVMHLHHYWAIMSQFMLPVGWSLLSPLWSKNMPHLWPLKLCDLFLKLNA